MKILGGALLGGATNNPLLATFAVIIGLLIWFNLVSTVTLLAASWIAVGMNDSGIPPQTLSDDEIAEATEKREADALRLASRLELEEAEQQHRDAPWYGKRAAGRRVRAAEVRVQKYAETPSGASLAAGAAGTADEDTTTSAFGTDPVDDGDRSGR
jgi:membrane protein